MQDQIQINRTIEALEGLKYDSLYDKYHKAIDIHLAVLENKMTQDDILKVWNTIQEIKISLEAWGWLTGELDEDLDETQLIKDWRKRVEGVIE